MTTETKAAVHKWISENARGIPGGGDVFGFNDSLTDVNIDGQINLAELAERIEASERDRCARVASDFTIKPTRSIHPDIPWDQMNEAAQSVAHTTAQQIAVEIRSGE